MQTSQTPLKGIVLRRHASEVIHAHDVVAAARNHARTGLVPRQTVDGAPRSVQQLLLLQRDPVVAKHFFLGHSSRVFFPTLIWLRYAIAKTGDPFGFERIRHSISPLSLQHTLI